ncbi:MAG TPA: DUF1499 domain-containing protein [Xanthobacteraceae bacterium]|jgi:hypothetical protein|nr:DUF1499 domain-containing protein [Xanthobacteraceae bacterium]
MVRRRVIEEPVSRLAAWSLRLALFSLVATFMALIVVRSGALDLVPALSTLAGALVLAAVAILLAFGAGIVIWRDGLGGLRQAVLAVLIGLALIGYPAYLGARAYQLPAIYDVTTDPIDPPQFDAIARLRPRDANPIAYQGLYAAELQHAAYPDIDPEETTASPQEAFDVAMKIVVRRKWRVVDARPPRGPVAGRPADGVIEAVARSLILGFPEDVVLRIRATTDGTRIDVRSASRYGRGDLGSNAARVRNLITDIDAVLSAPQPEKPQEKAPPPRPVPQPRGRSVRR